MPYDSQIVHKQTVKFVKKKQNKMTQCLFTGINNKQTIEKQNYKNKSGSRYKR